MSDNNAPEPTKRNRKKLEAQREKARQEKEHRRAEAVERDRQRYMLDHEGDHDVEKEAEEPSNEESAAERFQKELCWCIQQLEKGLQNLKPNAKQVEEAKKLLRTLKSPRAPMAKKRQVMRMTFGDYRTKMQREEKSNAAALKKTHLAPATPSTMDKATFFRKSNTAADPHSSRSRLESGSELATVPEADSAEGSITSLEKQAYEMTLGEASHQDNEDNDKDKEDVFVVADNEELPFQHDLKHCNPSCSRADHDNLSLRSSPSGASTGSSTTSFPAVLLGNTQQQHVDSSSNDSDLKSGGSSGSTQSISGSSFCFNFDIELEDVDPGPPPKKRPGTGGLKSAKPSKEESGSSESSPKIGELEKKGSKKGGGRRRKSKKKQQQIEQKIESVKSEKQVAPVMAVDNNSGKQIEKQELSSIESGEFKFNFPAPT